MTKDNRELSSTEIGLNSHRIDDGQGVWYFVEHQDGKIDDSCLKLASESRNVADKLGEEAVAIVIGYGVKGLVSQFIPYGTDKAFVVDDPHYRIYQVEAYVDIIIQLVESEKPRIILLAASTSGNDLAPRLAAKLQTPLIARYTEIEVDREKNLSIRKSIHGGNAQETVKPLKKPYICTIDTQTLSEQKVKSPRDTRIIDTAVRIDPMSGLTKVIDYLKADPCSVCVSEADIVIGVGKGLGCFENLNAVDELARTIGASVGGSRRATDERWIADERRIGLTGKTITPSLYLICGISGAFHHTLSIKGAKLKIAVNTDANAPIAKMADLMVVGDMQEIIPELTRQLRDLLKMPSS